MKKGTKKTIAIKIDFETWVKLKKLAIDKNKSMQDILAREIKELVFEKN